MSDKRGFIDEVNGELYKMGHQGLTFQQEEAVVKQWYDDEPAGNVWDGTRGQHYAKWVVRNFIGEPKTDVPEEPGPQRTITAFTSFGGADAIFCVNRQPVGEIEGIKWSQLFHCYNRPPIDAIMRVTVFDRETPVQTAIEAGPIELAVVFANEYGQRMLEVYDEPVFEARTGGVSVDMTHQVDDYHFKAMSVKRYRIPEDMPFTLDSGEYNSEIFTFYKKPEDQETRIVSENP